MTPEQKLDGKVTVTTLPLSRKAEQRGRKFGQLTLLSYADALAAPMRPYLVKGLLGAGEMGVIFGEPGCGKTFLALHLAHAVASGRTFFGHRVVQAPVIYAALEGEAGFAKRLKALRTERREGEDQNVPGFHYIAQALPLGADSSFVDDAIAAVREAGARLIVIDTLARAMAGLDENSAADMGKMVGIIDLIRQQTGAAVLVVHHRGKDRSRGARGSNALLGATDLEIEVNASETGEHTWKVTKAKDDPGGDKLNFTLRRVTLGDDADGDPISTCLVDEAGTAASTQAKKPPPQSAAALMCLHEALTATGQELPSGHGFPPRPVRGCLKNVWRQECDDRGIANSDHPLSHKRTFNRAVVTLKQRGFIAEYRGWVWLLRDKA
jgi:hypothetical protein